LRRETHATGLAREAGRKAKSQIDAWARNTNTSNRPSSNCVIAIHKLPEKKLNSQESLKMPLSKYGFTHYASIVHYYAYARISLQPLGVS